MAFATCRAGLLVVALGLVTVLATGCAPDTTTLEATVVAQGQLLERLARTSTPAPSPLPTASPTSTPTPIPTPSPVPTPVPSPTGTSTPTLATLVGSVLPSILRVTTSSGVGTGFVVWQADRVLTALHVVEDDPGHVVLLTQDGVQYRATVLAADARRDLALLSVKGLEGKPLPVSSGATVAEPVVVVGYQEGLPGGPSVTRGIVSATRFGPSGVAVVQTDAAVNPGASGGPVLSERGEVLGLVTFGIRGDGSELEGLGFAVAAQELEKFRVDADAGRLGPVPTRTRTPTPTPRSR